MKLTNRFRSLFFSAQERSVLRRLAAEVKPLRPRGGNPAVVVVDGILSDELVSMLYILFLLVLEQKLSKPIRVLLVSPRRRDALLKTRRIYSWFFETQTVALNSRLNAADQRTLDVEYRSVVEKVKGPDDLLSLTVDGIKMGPNIYSSYVRDNFTGSVPSINTAVKRAIWEGMRNLKAVAALMSRHQPDGLILTHTEYNTFGSLFKTFLKNGIPAVNIIPYAVGRIGGRVYRSMEGFEQDPKNYMFSVSDELFQKTKAAYSPEQDKVIKDYLSNRYGGNDPNFNGDYHRHTARFANEQLKRKLEIADDRPIALIATHLLWDDSTTSYHSLYADYERWLAATLRVVRDNSNFIWVVKGHPSEYHMGTQRFVKDIVRETFGTTLPENVRFVDGNADINTFSLLALANVIVTVRGTIGLEAACQGKPIVTAGSGPYSNLGFTKEFSSAVAYERYLADMDRHSPAVLTEAQVRDAHITCYAYFFLKSPPCPAISRGNKILSFKDVSAAEIYADQALNRFAGAVAKREECDLL